MTYNEEVQITCGVTNDADNLYVLFKFRDAEVMSSIFRTGVTIWMDPSCHERRNFGLTYRGNITLPQRQLPQGLMQGSAGRNQPLPDPMFQALSIEEMVYVDETRQSKQTVRADGKQGPEASLRDTLGIYCYEFALPLDKSANLIGIGTAPGEAMHLGFEFGGMNENIKRRIEEQNASGGPPGGGKGGGRGGRGGKGGGSNMMRGMQKSMEPTLVWMKVQLADGAAAETKN